MLNAEVFYKLKEAKVLIESWRQHYNQVRPYSGPGYRLAASKTIGTGKADPAFVQQRPLPDQAFPQTPFGLT